MKYLLFVIMLMASQAHAQQVYKCVKGKDVAYQSQPCPDSHKVQKQWDATPDPEPSVQDQWNAYYAKKKGARDSAYLRSLAGRSSSRASGTTVRQQTTSCDLVKEQRRRQFDAHPNRSYEVSRVYDDLVARACK